MNTKVERKELSHEAILESAGRFIRQLGISGTRVADVMTGAGLTVGGFYAHFGSKEKLIDETLRRTGDGLREKLFARLDEKPEGARFEVILKRYLSAAHRDAQTLGCPLPAVVGEIGTTAGEHVSVLSEGLESLVGGLREHLPRGTPQPRLLAIGLVALMYGGLSLARAVKGTPLSDEILRACRMAGVAVVSAIR